MCEDPVQAEKSMASDTHESQDLVVPGGPDAAGLEPAKEAPPSPGLSPPGTGPVNAITVLTLLDKLVNMLDTVQENQHKMEVRQAEMEGAVRGIQADMTKLSKSHTHTSNTVSKLLDKSRKVSVTMKEVRDRMERQAGQVKKLEANHAHLLKRNNFKVLIFQDENEIPSSVFVKEPVPFPRDTEEGEESSAALVDTGSQDKEVLHTIDLSSDEDAGLEAELDEDADGLGAFELSGEHSEKSRAEKIKRSSLKKVDSLKKAFSRQNIEKKMTKIGTKIVSQEKRDKIKKSLSPNHPKSPTAKSSSFKLSPLTFSIKKVREPDAQAEAVAPSPSAVASVELSPVGSPDQDLSFTQVHSQLAPELEEEAKAKADSLEKEGGAAVEEAAAVPEPSSSVAETEEVPEPQAPEADTSAAEGVSEEYANSATLPQEDSELAASAGEGEEEKQEEEEKKEEEKEVEEEKKEEEKEGEEKQTEEKEVEENEVEEKAAEENKAEEKEGEVKEGEEKEAEVKEAEVKEGEEKEKEPEEKEKEGEKEKEALISEEQAPAEVAAS